MSRYKLIDLLNADKVFQTVQNWSVSVLVFIASLGLVALMYVMLKHNGMRTLDIEFAGATVLVSIGTALFFFLSLALLRFCKQERISTLKGCILFIFTRCLKCLNWILVCALYLFSLAMLFGWSYLVILIVIGLVNAINSEMSVFRKFMIWAHLISQISERAWTIVQWQQLTTSTTFQISGNRNQVI